MASGRGGNPQCVRLAPCVQMQQHGCVVYVRSRFRARDGASVSAGMIMGMSEREAAAIGEERRGGVQE